MTYLLPPMIKTFVILPESDLEVRQTTA